MSRRLPPLNSLRAFEAAARHGNFRKAADELCVTHSAISHQIRLLEDHLEIELFYRKARAVELTEAGRQYLPVIQTSFDRIADGTETLRSNSASSELTVQVYTTFAISWMSPRLHEFQRQNPKLRVRLNMATWDVDLNREVIDVAIGTLTDQQDFDPDIHYQKLFTSNIFPVCSPQLLKNGPPLKNHEDLAKHTILRVDTWTDDWSHWLNEVGMSHLKLENDLTFDTYALSLEAALDGQGVAITRTPFGARELASGWLVAPFKEELRASDSWYVMTRNERSQTGKITAFIEWLQSTIANDPNLSS